MSNDEWGTPQWLFDLLNKEFKFDLDVCASNENHKCHDYYTKKNNGLKSNWMQFNFCNPPYSNQMPWLEKAVYECINWRKTTVMLCMCDTSTEFFKRCYMNAEEIRLLNHRIKFDGAKGSPRFASMIVVIKPTLDLAKIRLVDYRKSIK